MYIYRKTIKIPRGKRLYIVPLGDIQGEEQLGRLEELVQWCLVREKEGHIVRLLGCGDYFETFSPSERVKKAGAGFHETTLEMIERQVTAQADDCIQRLAPLKGRIMVMISGHHHDKIPLGRRILDCDEYIAESLKAEYGGNGIVACYLLINGLPFYIVAMHGYGSARTGGAKLNKRLAMREIFLNANVYFFAHDNSKVSDVREPFVFSDGECNYLKQYFSGIGCFQESYRKSYEAGYAEKLGLPPASIGVVILSIAVEEKNGKKRLDYHLSS